MGKEWPGAAVLDHLLNAPFSGDPRRGPSRMGRQEVSVALDDWSPQAMAGRWRSRPGKHPGQNGSTGSRAQGGLGEKRLPRSWKQRSAGRAGGEEVRSWADVFNRVQSCGEGGAEGMRRLVGAVSGMMPARRKEDPGKGGGCNGGEEAAVGWKTRLPTPPSPSLHRRQLQAQLACGCGGRKWKSHPNLMAPPFAEEEVEALQGP